ncbi:unnamed protein product, partial [marine sediment metagenome]
NDFYVNRLPEELKLPDREGFYSFDTGDGVGTYALPQYIIDIRDFTIDDGDDDAVEPLTFWHDKSAFFAEYPEDVGAATQQPTDILLFGETLYPRPIPDDTYTITAQVTQRPVTEFTLDADLPLQSSWGELIAYGGAIEILADDSDDEGIVSLKIRPFGYDYLLRLLKRKQLARLVGVRSKPEI